VQRRVSRQALWTSGCAWSLRQGTRFQIQNTSILPFFLGPWQTFSYFRTSYSPSKTMLPYLCPHWDLTNKISTCPHLTRTCLVASTWLLEGPLTRSLTMPSICSWATFTSSVGPSRVILSSPSVNSIWTYQTKMRKGLVKDKWHKQQWPVCYCFKLGREDHIHQHCQELKGGQLFWY
jgi:hypothetical protein